MPVVLRNSRYWCKKCCYTTCIRLQSKVVKSCYSFLKISLCGNLFPCHFDSWYSTVSHSQHRATLLSESRREAGIYWLAVRSNFAFNSALCLRWIHSSIRKWLIKSSYFATFVGHDSSLPKTDCTWNYLQRAMSRSREIASHSGKLAKFVHAFESVL